MKIIQDTKESLQASLITFDAFGVAALTSMGREFNDDGHLISNGSDLVTETYDVIHEDIEQGFYITHPEAFRGRWEDAYVDGLIDLIPETATSNLEFTRTIDESLEL